MRQTRRTRLLILDVDGTLLTDDYQITTATRAAVQQVAEWGVQVVLASARSPSALRRIMGTLGINGLAISYTGALTCRLSPDPHIPTEVITECRMSLSSARDVSRSAIAHGLSVGWFSGDNWYIPGWDEALCRESKITQTQPIVARNLIHFTEAPHKLLCIVGNPKLLASFLTLAKALPQDCVGQFSHSNYLEITHQGVNKATALLALGQQLGISPTEMVAIGDQENDVAMLQLAALGIAMGNAPPTVQAAADWITDTNNQDGVAHAINKLSATGWL